MIVPSAEFPVLSRSDREGRDAWLRHIRDESLRRDEIDLFGLHWFRITLPRKPEKPSGPGEPENPEEPDELNNPDRPDKRERLLTQVMDSPGFIIPALARMFMIGSRGCFLLAEGTSLALRKSGR
jgi:hypothetical protein